MAGGVRRSFLRQQDYLHSASPRGSHTLCGPHLAKRCQNFGPDYEAPFFPKGKIKDDARPHKTENDLTLDAQQFPSLTQTAHIGYIRCTWT